MDLNEKRELVKIAMEARKSAYTPYSHFDVGAALMTENGKIYKGCNIESAAYTPTCCAERTAFFKAISEGERSFKAIAVVGGKLDEEINELCPPCGVCRQVMMDFCNPDEFEVILARSKDKIQSFKLKELLPLGFGPENLS